MRTTTLLSILFLLLATDLQGQVYTPDSSAMDPARSGNGYADDMPLDEQTGINLEIPTLEQVFLYAMEHSPLLRAQDSRIDKAEIDVQLIKHLWMHKFKPNFKFDYGYYGKELLAEVNNITSVAINLSISPYEIYASKKLVNQAKHDLRITENERELLIRDLKIQITEYYQKLLLAKRLLEISIKTRQSMLIQQQLAEKGFLEGQVTIGDLSEVTSSSAKAESDFEVSKNDYTTLYLQLEQMIGGSLAEIRLIQQTTE